MDIRDLTTAATGLRQQDADMSDPRQHFAWALTFFPSPNTQMGDVPIQPAVRPGLSQILYDLGFRHQPELQTKWLVPGDHPEAGWLNVPRLVTAAEFQQYQAAHADPDVANDQWRDTAQALLERIDPATAARIKNMTPEERAAAAQTYRQQAPAAFDRLADLKKQLDGEGG